MGSTEKSISRKLRRLYGRLPSWTSDRAYTTNIFKVGKFASKLFPYWVESDYQDFQMYLYHGCGGFGFQASGKITIWAETYYEIPALGVWLAVGWRQAAQAATRDQEGQRDHLLESGLNVLDLLTLV